MCGVVGFIGKNTSSRLHVLKGLKRLEYRGYDSAGFSCLNESGFIEARKSIGELKNLINLLEHDSIDGHVGIGHTRWATHGGITQENAHPHFDCFDSVSLVHNGIIENHSELKQDLLKKNHYFKSDTDTEIIAHLIEDALNSFDNTIDVLSSVARRLKGAYAFVAILKQNPDELFVVRKSSPLCIGVCDDQLFVASDPFAFAGITDRVIYIPDEICGIIRPGNLSFFSFSKKPVSVSEVSVEIDWTDEEKKGYEHFMLKEIYQQKKAIRDTTAYLKTRQESVSELFGVDWISQFNLKSIGLIGCGTSWHAGRIGQFFFERIAGLPASVILASEFRDLILFPDDSRAYVALSQSGETADSLEGIRRMKRETNCPVLTVSNVSSSTMVRETDGALITQAGQEIAVASTKAFSTQLTTLYWLAHKIAFEQKKISKKQMEKSYEDLMLVAEVLEGSIEKYKSLIENELAAFYAQYKRFIFLGRQISYPFAMEVALKLKEISYIFSQCYPAGELKHGPIALLDDQTPVVMFSTLDQSVYCRLYANAREVKARNARLIVFAFEGQQELIDVADNAFIIPQVPELLGPLAMTGITQFFVYHIAKVLGRPIDKPRNLAKSVTVE